MIWWALIFEHIEWASTLVMFRLFIYLNIVRAGDIQLYTLFMLDKAEGQTYLSHLMYQHAYVPANWTIRNVGWMAPWCVEAFGLFFRASQLSTEAYVGRELSEIDELQEDIFGLKPLDWAEGVAGGKLTDFCIRHTDRGFLSNLGYSDNCVDKWRKTSDKEKLEWGRLGAKELKSGETLFMEKCGTGQI